MTRVADFAKDHRVHLLQGAQELFPALIEAMDAALSDIQFETYIFDFTGAGAQVAEALIRAAQRGVRTHLVVDGVGTGPLPKAWQQRMKSAGVQVRVYSPLGPLGLLLPHRWRRLHRKLCVVDGLVVFCGGINVLDDLYDPNYGDLDAPRFDFAVQATGSLAAQASRTMELLWWRMQAVRDVRLNRLPQAVRDLRAITGQQPMITRARKSIATFRLRAGMPIGCKVTLRGERMYEFLDRFFNVALPRVRDFRGINPNSFDGRGNYNMGLKEQLIFPEIEYDKVDKVRGMDICFVTTATTDEEARELLTLMGAPFSK